MYACNIQLYISFSMTPTGICNMLCPYSLEMLFLQPVYVTPPIPASAPHGENQTRVIHVTSIFHALSWKHRASHCSPDL